MLTMFRLIGWLGVMASVVCITNGHLTLTHPPARKYALDFLDNTRTTGPFGMEYMDGYPITNLVVGEVTATWHVAYPHKGGVKFDILNTNGTVLHNLTDDYLYLNDSTKLEHTLTLTEDMACDHCVLRIIRQAGEWVLGNPAADPRGYIFWSAADVKIISSTDNCYVGKCLNGGTCGSTTGSCVCTGTFAGDRCQYENDCNTATDCNSHGDCEDLQSTFYPKKVCFCEPGYFGRRCERESTITEGKLTAEEEKGFYKVVMQQDPLFELLWKVIGEDIEIAVKVKTNTWAAVGFRPDSVTNTCRNFPTVGGVTTGPAAEGEGTPAPETTAAPSRRKRMDYFEENYMQEINSRTKRAASGENVIKNLCESGDKAGADTWARWHWNGGSGTPPTASPEGAAPEGGTSAPEGETTAPEGEHSVAEGEGEPVGGNAPLHAMDCTDMAFVSAIGTKNRIYDAYTRDRSTPQRDSFYGGEESFTAAAARMEDGMLYARIKRKLVTTDKADYSYADQRLDVIWARGQDPVNFYHWPLSGLETCEASNYDYYKVNELKYHGTHASSRGTFQINVMEDPNATPTVQQSGDFKFPITCEEGNCNYYGSWEFKKDVNQIDIVMNAKVSSTQWVGIGFSEDQLMPNSDAVFAWMDGSTGVLSDRFLTGKGSGEQGMAKDASTTLTQSNYNNGIATYRFSRKTDLTGSDDLNLEEKCFYMIHAWGGEVNNGEPAYHGNTGRDAGVKVCLGSGFMIKNSPLLLALAFALSYILKF